MSESASNATDQICLTTVGIDIGSATSHLLLSRLVLRPLSGRLSSRFVVVDRASVWESPVLLTPYSGGDLIDQAALQDFVTEQYAQSGLSPSDVDTGAVILTGNALLRRNAKAVADILSMHAGRLVCAAAGHDYEARLAARGSGAVARSTMNRRSLVNVDIGGGTTKFALVVDGSVIDTAVLGVGARLLTWDAAGTVTATDERLTQLAPSHAAELSVGRPLPADAEHELGALFADRIVAFVHDLLTGMAAGSLLEPTVGPWQADELTFSGGVSEYLNDPQLGRFGDLGAALGSSLRSRSWPLPHSPFGAGERGGIRATVVGVGQFSTQVSGSTIFVSKPDALPVHSLAVVRPLVDGVEASSMMAGPYVDALQRGRARSGGHLPALSLKWHGIPAYRRLRGLCDAVAQASAQVPSGSEPLVIAVDEDIAHNIGRILTDEIGVDGEVVCLDGVDVDEFDYLDVGQPILPVGAVPVVVKSLLFPKDISERHMADRHEQEKT